MDSNDSGRGHWNGGCEFTEVEVERWQKLFAALAAVPPETMTAVREELKAERTSSDAYWAQQPAGPAKLQVLCDQLGAREGGWSARAVASMVFDA